MNGLHIPTAPGAYRPEDVKLDHTPSYSFGNKFDLIKPNTNPGNYLDFLYIYKIKHLKPKTQSVYYVAPGSYHSESVNLDHSPAFTFGHKTKLSKTNDTPGTPDFCV